MFPPRRPVEVAEIATERLLAEAGWYALQDRILGRISHDLNGRAMFLETTVGWLDSGRHPPPALAEEVARVWELAELLTLVTSKLDSPPAAIGGQDVLRSVLRLYRLLLDRNADPGFAQIDEPLPPVLVSEPRFVRSALLFLDLARPSPWSGTWIRANGDADRLLVRAPATVDVEAGVPGALRKVLELDGGNMRFEDGHLVLEVASLTAARLRAAKGPDVG